MQLRFALAPVLFMAGSQPALACLCGPPAPNWTLADRVSQYASVFYGEVISVDPVARGHFDRALWLKVIKRYRGEAEGETTVYMQSFAKSMCGARREVGDRFIVASSLFEGVESISYCSSQQQTGFTLEQLDALPFVRGPATPRPAPPTSPPMPPAVPAR